MKRGSASDDSVVAQAVKRLRCCSAAPAFAEGTALSRDFAAGYAKGCRDTHEFLMSIVGDELREVERQTRERTMIECAEDVRSRMLVYCRPAWPADPSIF